MYEPSDLTAALIIGLLSIIGLVINLTFVVAVLRNITFRSQAYYILAISLASSDSIMLMLFIFYSTPSTLLGRELGGPVLNRIMGAFCNLTWFCGFIIIAALSVNRFISICFSHLAPFWFTVEF